MLSIRHGNAVSNYVQMKMRLLCLVTPQTPRKRKWGACFQLACFVCTSVRRGKTSANTSVSTEQAALLVEGLLANIRQTAAAQHCQTLFLLLVQSVWRASKLQAGGCQST